MSSDRRTPLNRTAVVVSLPTTEPTVLLQGTEEWLSTLDDPHDATAMLRRKLSESDDLPEDES